VLAVDQRMRKDLIHGEHPSSELTGAVRESHQAALFLVVVPTGLSKAHVVPLGKAALPVGALVAVVGAAVVVGPAVAAAALIVAAIAAYAGIVAVIDSASVGVAVADDAGDDPIHCT